MNGSSIHMISITMLLVVLLVLVLSELVLDLRTVRAPLQVV